MGKKSTKKSGGSNNALIIGGVALGALFLLSKNSGESAQETLQNIFPSGDGGGGILDGFLSGLGLGTQQGAEQGYMTGLLDGLFSGGGLTGDGGGINLDFSGLFEGLGGGGGLDLSGLGIGGEDGILNTNPFEGFDFSGLTGGSEANQYTNTIPNILNALSNSVDSLGKGLLYGAGTYLGVKALSPVAPAIGNLVAGGFKGITPGVTSALGHLGSGISRAASFGVSNIGTWMTTPVSSLGVTGTLAALPAVLAAGAAGYGIGTVIEPYTSEAAGDIGRFTARNLQDVPVIGGVASDWLGFSHAETKVSESEQKEIKKLLKQGYTPGQAAMMLGS